MEVELRMVEKIRKKLRPYKKMGLSNEELEYLGRKYLGKQRWNNQKSKIDVIKFLTF